MTQSRPDLAELLRATSQGDRAASRALYDATSAKLFGVVLRITSNRAIAEEVLQETYIKVWQSADRFAPDAGRPVTWLATIARNRAIDRIRSEKFDRTRVDDDDDALSRLAAPLDVDPAARESLRSCLAGLEEDARRCVTLAYCWGFSREELAERFGRPVGTIKTLLHRTIKSLRACLEKE